jgi:hypothetical protein
MTLINLLIFVIILGLVCYLFSFLPIPEPFRTVAIVLAIIILILVLSQQLGWVSGLRLR